MPNDPIVKLLLPGSSDVQASQRVTLLLASQKLHLEPNGI